jgi:hypothetical protein
LKSPDGIYKFNSFLLKEIKGKKNIVGVSLKKTGTNPRLDAVNTDIVDTSGMETDEIQISVPSAKDKKPMPKDAYIIDTGEHGLKMQIRSFSQDTSQGVQGELKGKKANMGKIGNSGLISYFKKNNIALPLTRYKKAEEILIKNNKKIEVSDDYSNAFINASQKASKNKLVVNDLRHIKSKKDLQAIVDTLLDKNKNDIQKVAGILSSKIQSMEIAGYSDEDFLVYAYLFASSKLDISAPYLKLWES